MNRTFRFLTSFGKRACALIVCTAMLLGLLPTIQPQAQAASSTQDMSLDRLVSWGIMRGDQYGNLDPARDITRAEFASMLNRTFGYQQTGAQPFRDVVTSNWYYDDISIAYTAGYFEGTSNTTASPNSTLTREQAATLLCRNLMLQPLSGEDLAFTDSREASSWSRGYIKAAAEEGILVGDPGGTFRPRDNITRGEVAIMLVRVIGTPIQEPGTYSNSVSGNLMVSTSGVTLENMTVTGDLYITGGVGLGYITLSNVTVYGKIIASGAGESDRGDCSIILKNSSAPEMLVDSPSNQYVTIRSVGNTDIGQVHVRTGTYLESRSTGDYGFQHIIVDGENGTQLDLAGNIHDVVTMTPESTINVGSGTVEELTVDEEAVDSVVTIAQGAVVEILNLDTATRVTGEGDIGTANINAAGCVIEMLPDIIVIRPGITANIDGIIMDSTLAEQMSDTPRILSGYPRMDDIAPNQAQASFQTNKPGTLYWAVRLSGDGPMEASDLINPPTYGGQIVRSGNLAISDANTTVSQRITGLTLDTSYVLSAVLVDSRDDESAVKSVYFTTPDDSDPAFTSGYPRASTIEDTYVDFDVAATKNCTLYWAIYPTGMSAPTANEFKDGNLSGAIDSGSRRVARNEEDSIRMGSENEEARNALEELTEYDAFFFLSDGINDSNVVRVQVTTADRTPPEFLTNYPRITEIQATALTGDAAINEDGQIYWAAVIHGTDYPIPNSGLTDDAARELDQKLQIMGGMYAVASGSFNANANTAASFNMRGLTEETAYDIYFVAEDDSGNLSDIVVLENARTLDNNAPTLVGIRFSQANDQGTPLANTDITLVFSEDIYSRQTRMSLVEMFESDQTEFVMAGSNPEQTLKWEDIFREMFTLNNLSLTTPDKSYAFVLGEDGKENIRVELNDSGQTEVTFLNASLALQSGSTYQFVFNAITDSSSNNMPENTQSEEFRILDAQVDFTELPEVTIDYPDSGSSGTTTVDKVFSMIPYASSTANASENTCYDVLIASDTTISFNLYYRERTDTATQASEWHPILDATDQPIEEFSITYNPGEEWTALSLNQSRHLSTDAYPKLREMMENGYEFALKLTAINQNEVEETWDATVNIKVFCVAGGASQLLNLTGGNAVTSSQLTADITAGNVTSIGNPGNFNMEIRRVNQGAPAFVTSYPRLYPGDSVTQVDFQLDRSGTLYYVVAPANRAAFPTMKPTGSFEQPALNNFNDLNQMVNLGNLTNDPSKLPGQDTENNLGITRPTSTDIMQPLYDESLGYRFGSVSYTFGSGPATFTIEDLQANTNYYIYFVLRGTYANPSFVYCYTFSTEDVVPPELTARVSGSGAVYTVLPGEDQERVEAETYWSLYPYSPTDGYPAELQDIIDDAVTSDNQDTLWNLIVNPNNGRPAPLDSGRTPVTATSPAGASTVVEPDGLQPNTEYVLFVAAKNVLGGNPVFAAATNIHIVDLSYPRITNINVGGIGTIDPSDGTCTSAQVTVIFDKPLYVQGTESVDTYSYYPRNNDVQGDFPISFTGNYGSSNSVLYFRVRKFKNNDTFQVTPTYWSNSDQKEISVQPYFCSQQGVGRPNYPLSFRMVAVTDDTGAITGYTCVINGGDYNGQTSETTATN